MQLTTNTQAFIDAEQYSQFILLTLKDGLLPESFYRDVTDFGEGDTLNIKTVGTVTLQEASEDTPLTYQPIESGTITMSITDYVGDAWYVTDDLREDGTLIDRLMAERAAESTRALQENFESRFLEVAATAHSDSDPYNVNGFAHKVVSTDGNGVFTTSMLVDMKLAFDKANVPQNGRVFIADPIVEATLNKLVTITHDVTDFGKRILEEGLSNGMRYSMSLYGFDIIVSNRLYVGDANDGTTSITGAIWNLVMCVADDQCKPIMSAWRRQPKTEGERNKDRARDEFVTRARWGFGVQRMDTMGVIATHPSNTTAA